MKKVKTDKTISLVMCVKNEEVGLERAIKSCVDFVDEIIIAVDTDTTDNTLEIAKKYTKNIKIFDFDNDFSKMRNEAHQGAKGDWILFLDGHEYVKEYRELNKMLNANADGLLCTIEMESGATFHNPRLYKNGVQFAGAVHEKQQLESAQLYPQFVIKHDRLKGQSESAQIIRAEQRDKMVPEIMGETLKHNPRNTRALFHMALFNQGKQNYLKAIKYYTKFVKYSDKVGEIWFSYFNMALCHLARKNYCRAFINANQAERVTPKRWENKKLLGLIFFDKGEYDRALDYFVKVFDIPPGHYDYNPWVHNNSEIWNIMGECFFRKNQIEKAATCFDRASELATEESAKQFLKARCNLMVNILRDDHKKMRGFTDREEVVDKNQEV